MATIHSLKAGKTKRIIRRVAHNMPQRFSFAARALNGEPVSGVVKVQGSSGPFSKPATTQPLQAKNEVSKGAWDTLYSVYVTPDQDVEITQSSVEGGKLFIFLIIGILVIGIAASALLLSLK